MTGNSFGRSIPPSSALRICGTIKQSSNVKSSPTEYFPDVLDMIPSSALNSLRIKCNLSGWDVFGMVARRLLLSTLCVLPPL